MSLSSLLDKAKTVEAERDGLGSSPQPRGLTPAGANSFAASTPPTNKKIAADSLPFGLGESPAFGKQSMASLGGSRGAASSNTAKLGQSGKLLKAAKTVQNMVRVTNISAAPRVPALSTAAEREDFEELMKRNDEYFARLLSGQVRRLSRWRVFCATLCNISFLFRLRHLIHSQIWSTPLQQS